MQILLVDKNLGPIVVNKDDYVKAISNKRLSGRNAYEIITKKEEEEYLLESTDTLLRFYKNLIASMAKT